MSLNSNFCYEGPLPGQKGKCAQIVRVSSSGLPRRAYPELLGQYEKQFGLVNGRAWYQQSHGENLIFRAENGNWHITSEQYLGTSISDIWTSGEYKCPHHHQSIWSYWRLNGPVGVDRTLKVRPLLSTARNEDYCRQSAAHTMCKYPVRYQISESVIFIFIFTTRDPPPPAPARQSSES